MQQKKDSLESFLDRFKKTHVQSGLSLVRFCQKAGIARSLYYEIRDGDRTISDKVWQKLAKIEWETGQTPEKGFNVPHGTLKKGSDAENSTNPNDSRLGDSAQPAYANPANDDAGLVVLERIAVALESIAASLRGR